eukprot:CAMPEP_0201560076 /NCGR_PEP_ID=MMETSP0173_2-20130828/78018_1 /ASSEMBLY_ACC=CAM_ASM_000268 /TAXON_ID=218659 /ORGANISM="Vexillifera sp., Strain DIVA3 564/2" /LENGTH=95 /DNA_ID=CAMNT_0047974497 /DNA_START=21 /DNA_END=304 /DNA_ORIENTATION=+
MAIDGHDSSQIIASDDLLGPTSGSSPSKSVLLDAINKNENQQSIQLRSHSIGSRDEHFSSSESSRSPSFVPTMSENQQQSSNKRVSPSHQNKRSS